MTRILSAIALIGLVSAGPALADSGNGAQVFERNAIALQGGDTAHAPQVAAKAHTGSVTFDRADRSATSGR